MIRAVFFCLYAWTSEAQDMRPTEKGNNKLRACPKGKKAAAGKITSAAWTSEAQDMRSPSIGAMLWHCLRGRMLLCYNMEEICSRRCGP